MTLSEFLQARLAEDEAVALAAGGEEWRNGEPSIVHPDPTVYRTVLGPVHDRMQVYVAGSILAANAEHIAQYDPARVLAEVAAKREMLPHLMIEDLRLGYCDRCMVLRLLASVYADHPDYRPEWAP